MADVTTSAETNVITTTQMKKVREVDFVRQFGNSILPKLLEVLGVTRKIEMIEGTTLSYYKTEGQLVNDGTVAEGEIIPLSKYERKAYPVGTITLKKWRKAATAEAILKSGYEEAVIETDAALLKDVQKGIRSDFFGSLADIDDATEVTGETLQAVFAKAWGNLQVLFEDDAIEPVHFVNPLDVSDYLATASITTQTAFGLKYVEDFLGLGTVVLTSQVDKGSTFSTAKNNIIMYYVGANADAMKALGCTADESGFIGINSGYATENRAQVESLVMSGIKFLVEYAGGVVAGTIGAEGATGATGATGA